jgi:hypothetical protein
MIRCLLGTHDALHQGPTLDVRGEDRGIVPRMFEDIFSRISTFDKTFGMFFSSSWLITLMSLLGVEFEVRCNMLEIYQEIVLVGDSFLYDVFMFAPCYDRIYLVYLRMTKTVTLLGSAK